MSAKEASQNKPTLLVFHSAIRLDKEKFTWALHRKNQTKTPNTMGAFQTKMTRSVRLSTSKKLVAAAEIRLLRRIRRPRLKTRPIDSNFIRRWTRVSRPTISCTRSSATKTGITRVRLKAQRCTLNQLDKAMYTTRSTIESALQLNLVTQMQSWKYWRSRSIKT